MNLLALLKRAWRALVRVVQMRPRAEVRDSGPQPIRIAVLGHSGAGKTVFYTMLFHDLRTSSDLTLTASTGQTLSRLQNRIGMLFGRTEKQDEAGRMVPLKIEPEWPSPDSIDETLNFVLRLPNGKSAPLEMIEFPGEDIAPDRLDGLFASMAVFLPKADCVFFIIDPDRLNNEWKLQECIGAYEVLLHKAIGNRRRPRIPLGAIVTKADKLHGFAHREQAILLPPTFRSGSRTTLESVQKAALASEPVRRDPVWRDEVTRVLDRASRLLSFVLQYASEFQIFFVSATGTEPPGTNALGESIPPKEIQSIGLDLPLRWWAGLAAGQARERGARRLVRYATVAVALSAVSASCWYCPQRSRHQEMMASLAMERGADPRDCGDEARGAYSRSWIASLHRTYREGVLAGLTPVKKAGDRRVQYRCEGGCDAWANEQLVALDCVGFNSEAAFGACRARAVALGAKLKAICEGGAQTQPVQVSNSPSDGAWDGTNACCWDRLVPVLYRRVEGSMIGVMFESRYAELTDAVREPPGAAGPYEQLLRVFGKASELSRLCSGAEPDLAILPSALGPVRAELVKLLADSRIGGEDWLTKSDQLRCASVAAKMREFKETNDNETGRLAETLSNSLAALSVRWLRDKCWDPVSQHAAEECAKQADSIKGQLWGTHRESAGVIAQRVRAVLKTMGEEAAPSGTTPADPSPGHTEMPSPSEALRQDIEQARAGWRSIFLHGVRVSQQHYLKYRTGGVWAADYLYGQRSLSPPRCIASTTALEIQPCRAVDQTCEQTITLSWQELAQALSQTLEGAGRRTGTVLVPLKLPVAGLEVGFELEGRDVACH